MLDNQFKIIKNKPIKLINTLCIERIAMKKQFLNMNMLKNLMVLIFAVVSMMFFVNDLFAKSNNKDGKCVSCHEGIEVISDIEDMAELTCGECHRGNAVATKEEIAHKGMWANPADFRIVNKTCGQTDCHEDHVANSKKSLHATMAGIISGTRYTWGAQNTKNALYAAYPIEDKDGNVPLEKGANKSLKQIPKYDPSRTMSNKNHPADDYLRDQCLRCHLWSSGHERDGDYRGSGCTACHVVYSDKGTYEGKDKAISKTQKDRPKVHKITVKIPSYQCIHCHNRGGRTGVSYIGTMESDGYGSPWATEPGKKGGVKLHGKYYNYLEADIHYDKGMECIDCHTSEELHGDGNIYSKKEQAVEIECQDCHGTMEKRSNLMTSWGNAFENLRKEDGKVILTTKVTERDLIIPQVKDIRHNGSENAQTAMGITNHMETMECYACHARWAPQCYGCHVQQDLTKKSNGWIDTKHPEDLSKSGLKVNRGSSTWKWRETRSYLRWEIPTLGINTEGKVAPFIPGCQIIFTQIGDDGKVKEHNKIYKTFDGFSGLAHNPIQPHTITKKARSCEDCHASAKAVGLGSGYYKSRKNGLDIDFELERIVDEAGKQIQATSHEGARPFNKEEINKILRVNVCISCHNLSKEKHIWSKVTDILGFAKTNKEHKKLLKKVFEKGVGFKKSP